MPASMIRSLDKAMQLLALIAADTGATPLTRLGERLGLPPTTVHRIAASLEARGFLVRAGRGRHLIGPAISDLATPLAAQRAIAGVGAPIVAALAKATRLPVHLGVLEDDMVTYLIKEGRGRDAIFTAVGQQLEAYCSAIGKVLLAFAPEAFQERYLSTGPLVALTSNTITDINALRTELDAIRVRGFALDDHEIHADISCIAAPIRDRRGVAVAALSLSQAGGDIRARNVETLFAAAAAAAAAVEHKLYPI